MGSRLPSTALLYLHGNNNYVTVDARGQSRVPDWAADAPKARAGALEKPAAPLAYQLDRLEAQNHAALVLVPEDATLAHNAFWATEPREQYRDPTRLRRLIADSFDHLQSLRLTESRGSYMGAGAKVSNLRRLCVSGHSGAGLPLQEAAASEVCLPPRGIPTDLWLFDCTYWSEIGNFMRFCAEWNRIGKLAAGRRESSRFVCVYRPQTQTEAIADVLRGEVARVLGCTPESLVTDYARSEGEDRLRSALQNNGVLFIRTPIPHDDIPTFFIPRLLETAAKGAA